MRIAMVCYPSVGGSGIVATELGLRLAERGHQVHFISADVPFRLRGFHENISFHPVETPGYYLFREPPAILSCANKIAEVHRRFGLDLVHAHYAIPHATSAYLAREMCGRAFKVVTTLHGTDITLMAQEPSYADSIAFAIEQSDAVTAVSAYLRQQTYATLPVQAEIRTIYNFLDCTAWQPGAPPGLRERYAPAGEKLIMHMSNLRPVKRVDRVVQVFAGIARELPARLLLVGEGPECARAWNTARELGVLDRVHFLGNQEDPVPLLTISDLFLLPSETESFGLAALEAMACLTPVVASRVGGLPEVVVEGETGFLRDPADVAGMVAAGLQVLTDQNLWARLALAGEHRVRTQFCADRIVPQYEALYAETAGRGG